MVDLRMYICGDICETIACNAWNQKITIFEKVLIALILSNFFR